MKQDTIRIGNLEFVVSAEWFKQTCIDFARVEEDKCDTDDTDAVTIAHGTAMYENPSQHVKEDVVALALMNVDSSQIECINNEEAQNNIAEVRRLQQFIKEESDNRLDLSPVRVRIPLDRVTSAAKYEILIGGKPSHVCITAEEAKQDISAILKTVRSCGEVVA